MDKEAFGGYMSLLLVMRCAGTARAGDIHYQ